MNIDNMGTAKATAGVLVSAATAAIAADSQSLNEAIAGIKDKQTRVKAWQSAAELGAPAVKPLALLLDDADNEVMRAAKRALWQIVRHAGRPEADLEAKAVIGELIPLINHGSSTVRRETMWMISEIGGNEAAAPIAALLADKELREDARLTLQRLPGKASLQALKAGFAAAPEEFKPNLAQSLRARGEAVEGYPSQRLIPTRPTSVQG